LLIAAALAAGIAPAPLGDIAFEVARAADIGVAGVSASGAGRRPLGLPRPTIPQRPAFSPDGRRVAYVCGNFRLCVASVDGRRRALVTTGRDWIYDGSPAWRPDGRQLAFSSNRRGRYRIFVVGVDGRGLRAVSRGSGDDENPSWSPDGRRIAYDSKVGRAFRLFVVDVRSGRRRSLGPRTGSATSPSWSPDGKWIAFTHRLAAGSQIELVRVDRKGKRVLTRGSWRDDHPAWSPDGRWLVFDTNRGGGLHIWRVRAAGGRPAAVTSGGAVDLFPSWRPRLRRPAAAPWPRAQAPAAPTGNALVVAAFVRRLLAIGTDFSLIKSNAAAAAAGIQRDTAAAKAEVDSVHTSGPRGARLKNAALQAIASAARAGDELSLGIAAYTRRDRKLGTQHFQQAFKHSRDFALQVRQAQRLADLLV
jgi:WD40 repeat protein